jgi:hypothetical protein
MQHALRRQSLTRLSMLLQPSEARAPRGELRPSRDVVIYQQPKRGQLLTRTCWMVISAVRVF